MFKKVVIADVYVNEREKKNNGQDDNNHYSIGEQFRRLFTISTKKRGSCVMRVLCADDFLQTI
jgi:hypothetical protein